jgi:hypothetical protein
VWGTRRPKVRSGVTARFPVTRLNVASKRRFRPGFNCHVFPDGLSYIRAPILGRLPRSLRRSLVGAAQWQAIEMTVSDNWHETLRCRNCGLIGVAHLSQSEEGMIVIKALPVGFRAVSGEHGDTFFCKACNRSATSSLK